MGRVARGIPHCDEGAEAQPEHDRPLDSERVAELAHVVRPAIQAQVLRTADVAPPASSLVEVHHLCSGREPRAELHLEDTVVEAWPRMQQEHRQPLPHPRAVRDELRAVGVEEEANVADTDAHWV